MPRPPRIDYPGARHHVMNRGAGRRQIFWNDTSCERFLDLLGMVVERYGIVVHAYALMPNHFHLMVESARANLSRAMQNLQFRYSQEVNLTPSYDGALFRGRFRNKLVLEEAHWFYLLSYIHLNPVRARMVNHPDRYPWTSHGAYANERECPEWLTTEDMREYFETEGGYSEWLGTTMNHRQTAPPDFDSVLFESRRGARHMMLKQPEVKSSISAPKALRQVVRVTGVEEQEIISSRRGAGGHPARALAVWWLICGAGQTNRQVGAILDMSSSAVSKIMRKLDRHPNTYLSGQVTKWQRELSNKGQ